MKILFTGEQEIYEGLHNVYPDVPFGRKPVKFVGYVIGTQTLNPNWKQEYPWTHV